jgi:signal peptidase I
LTQSPVGPIDKTGGIATLPIDKKENYIKRCVAVGGDTLEIKNNMLYINNPPEEQKDEVIFNYNFYFKPGSYIPQDKILEDFEVYNDQHTRYNIENKYISIIDTSYKDSIVYTKKLVAFSKEQITCPPQT